MREILLKEKASKVQAELERWAKKSKILRPGECIVFSLSIDSQPTVVQGKDPIDLDMSTYVFFVKENLMNLGMSAVCATRALGAVRYHFWKWKEVNGKDEGEPIYKTMRQFVAKYKHESQWQDLKYLRRGKTSRSLAEALRKAGLWT